MSAHSWPSRPPAGCCWSAPRSGCPRSGSSRRCAITTFPSSQSPPADQGRARSTLRRSMTVLSTSDGLELAARTWSANGEPRASVVLVHGLAATKDNLELVAVATALQDRGFDVLAYDARGHGASG